MTGATKYKFSICIYFHHSIPEVLFSLTSLFLDLDTNDANCRGVADSSLVNLFMPIDTY